MLREIFIGIFLLPIFTILTFPLVIIGFIIGIWNKHIQYKMAKFIIGIASNMFFMFNGAKVHVKGLDNIPKNKSVLFIGNHRSYIDIPLLIKYVPFPIAFVAKKSLKKIPILNIWMSMLGCLFLDRKNIRNAIKTIKKGIEMLNDGHSLVIFPEGTRSKTNDMLPFKQGSLKLAEKSNSLIIPFAIKGTDDLFEKNNYILKPCDIYLSFGKPINLNNLNKEDSRKSALYVQNIVHQLFLEFDLK